MTERVLLLGDDLRAFLAIARSLGRRGVEVHAAPSDFSSSALQSRYIAASHRLPAYPLDPGAWEAEMASLIAEKDFRFVVPTSDSGLFMLRHHADRLGRRRIGIPNEEALQVFSDKANTRALACAHDVPVARGALLDGTESAQGLAAALGLPLVLKPRASYALGDIETKRSALVVRDEGELDRQLRSGAWQGSVAESFFPGCGIGLSVLASEGRLLLAYQHRRLRESSETGASTSRVSERPDPALLEAARSLSAAVKLDGVAMFEFRVDRRSRRHVLLEVNPRFWGSLPLAVAAGADFPAAWWDFQIHGREPGTGYRPGIAKADLTGEFTRAVDRFEKARGLSRVRAAASGLVTAVTLLTAREGADSWAADDEKPWRDERAILADRFKAALRKRLPGRVHRRRVRFEDVARRIADRAEGRVLRLVVIGRENVCRSAFGERLLRLRLAGLPVEVVSAGFVPRRGAFPDVATLSAAAELGVDLAGHSSNALSLHDLERADALILVDEDAEWRLRQMAPGLTAELIPLPELDVAGPGAFPGIAAALTRLASVIEKSCRPTSVRADGPAAVPRRQAA